MSDAPEEPGTAVAVNGEDGQQPAVVAMAPIIGATEMSQATRVELGRAVAEVQAAVIVAQSRRRDMRRAEEEMLRACQHREMAEQAFYRYPRGGQNVTGPTVGLMRELMRCFGNAQSGIGELQRLADRSEMIAWAWDLEQNVRMSTTFWVTHARDTRAGRAVLESDRDIYENNANLGARRERAMIERILPAWFVAMATAECRRTMEIPKSEFPNRLKDCLAKFAELGVTQADLELKTGQPVSAWASIDLVNLGVVYASLARQEVTLDEEFPAAADRRSRGSRSGGAAGTLAAAKAAQGGASGGPGTPAPGTGGGGSAAPGPATGSGTAAPGEPQGETLKDLMALFTQAGWGGRSTEHRQVRLDVASVLARTKTTDLPLDISSANDLNPDQVRRAVRAMRIIAEEETAKAEGDADQAATGMHARLEKITEGVAQARAEAAAAKAGDPQ